MIFKRRIIDGVRHIWIGPFHTWSGISSTTGKHHWGWKLGRPTAGLK